MPETSAATGRGACPSLTLPLQISKRWLACAMLTVSPLQLKAHAEQLATNPPAAPVIKTCPQGSFENVPVFYLNSSDDSIKTILLAMEPTLGCGQVLGVNIGSTRSVAIFGDPDGRASLKRSIGSFDLPRERVNMDLWAIQISSASPAKLTDVMGQVQRVVDQTREAMQETYKELSDLSYQNTKLNPSNHGIFNLRTLGFSEAIALGVEPPNLSLIQMLLRLNFAEDPIANYNQAAQKICNFFAGKANDPKFKLFNEFEGKELKAYDVQRIFNNDPPRAFRRPFQGFMAIGLKQHFTPNESPPMCGDGAIQTEVEKEKELQALERRQQAIMRFAREYQKFQQDRQTYNPSELAKSASIVDGMVGPTVDAINRDIEAYFIRPTLFKIKQIVGRNRGVEYAEVGRSTIAGINGQNAKVISGTISSFDEPTPLRLGNWLNNAKDYLGKDGSVPTVFPNFTGPKVGTLGALTPSLNSSNLPLVSSLLGTLPTESAVALLAALSEEEVRWQSLSSGIKLDLTPTLMRDQTQAEVKVNLTIADPATLDSAKDSKDPAQYNNIQFRGSDQVKMRPLSRISKSIIDTKVYVNTMDLFALGSFNNQTTVTGRRWYVPLLGTIWEGAFGDIPVVGGWFSFKRAPQNVQHQSIILANTLIVPSAMGMASYFNASTETLYGPSPSHQQPLRTDQNSWQIKPGSL
jgi:hypothetical protein